MATYVAVNSLPVSLQRALSRVGYRRKDVSVEASESVNIQSFGSAGVRDFVVIVNMVTGEAETRYGSWGGPNMFNPRNMVDNDDRNHVIPPNGAVIKGGEGGGRPVSAYIIVRPDALAPMLPAIPQASPAELAVLRCYSYKAGEYRQSELRRCGVTDADIDACVSKGWLKRASNGATSITTAGKNVRSQGKAAL